PRLADGRSGALSRGVERGRLRARDVRPAGDASGPQAPGADDRPARARRGAGRTRGIDRGAAVTEHLKSHYEKPAEMYDGLRLHQNENTEGCSPRVLEALARLTRENLGFYPPYSAATDAAARYLGVTPDRVALVNGLDEGIMGAAIAYLRPAAGSGVVPEAVVPEPAFEIFRFDTAVAGGRLVQVMPKPDFVFALDEVLAAITPATRIVFVTNPNNPTGVSTPLDAIRAVAKRIPKEAIV